MKVNYRLAEESDLEAAHNAMVEALDQFAMQRGLPLAETEFEESLPLWRHFLVTSDEGFWVAEVKGKLAGFTCSVVRDRLLLLSHLAVRPEFQGEGIGGELLKRTLERADGGKAKIVATCADAYNWPSLSLYARHGMFPRIPILRLQGSIVSLQAAVEEVEPPECEVTTLSEEAVATLGEIDKEVRGTHRHEDHRFWLGAPEMRCYLAQEKGKPVGYLYLSNEGTIGPLATLEGGCIPPLLNFAIERLADQGVDTFLVRVPGMNTEAISLLYQRGFTLQEMHLVMSSQPFGRWENYIISRPSLL